MGLLPFAFSLSTFNFQFSTSSPLGELEGAV